jgi:MFS transporter, DHA2 family, multidrug resistance protein
MLARGSRATTAILAANATAYDPATQSMLAQMKGAFMAAGADAATATSRSYAAMFGLLQRQAAMVSFVAIFQLLGILFLVLLPLVLLMQRPRRAGAPAAR